MRLPTHIRVASIIIAVALSIIYGLQNTDFNVYLDAATAIRNHLDIYTLLYDGLQYYYSPLFAMILVPFTFLPVYVSSATWVFFSLCLVWLIWKHCAANFPGQRLTSRQYNTWLLLSLFYMFSFILYNIARAQLTIFLVFGSLISLWCFETKRNIRGGLLLALIINIKIMPVLLLPYLLYRNYIAGFLLTVAFTIVYFILPAVFIGYDYNLLLHTSWWHSVNPMNACHLAESHKLLHSLVSTIPVYLSDLGNELNMKVNFVNLSLQQAEWVCLGVRAFLVMLALVFFRTLPFTAPECRKRRYWEVSYLLLITPLVFPHQNKYSYFYVFPAFIYLVYFMIVIVQAHQLRKNMLTIAYLIVISLIYTPIIGRDILGNYFFDMLQIYRVLVISTVLIIPALLVCSPEKLQKLEEMNNDLR